jgi:hypothetical protein
MVNGKDGHSCIERVIAEWQCFGFGLHDFGAVRVMQDHLQRRFQRDDS